MQRWGKTDAGKQRYRCRPCRQSAVRSRADNRDRLWRQRFMLWVTSNAQLTTLAARYHVSCRTLQRRFASYWDMRPSPRSITHPKRIRLLVLDATSVAARRRVTLIVHDPETRIPVGWSYAPRECRDAWYDLCASLAEDHVVPMVVIGDGQKGLLTAIRTIWPSVQVQRCLIHVDRQARAWLTRNPKTRAGRALLDILNGLLRIRTRRQKRRWIRAFWKWCRIHETFLKERTPHPTLPRRWWYTHRKLRAVRSLLRNAIPDLFVFVSHPDVPRTSNHVEGGVNSRIKELYRSHRGLSLEKKTTLTAWYLAKRQGQKPTRFVH